MIPYKQLSLADIFENCQNKFDHQKNQFLELLENTIDLDEIVPPSFAMHFHSATGRPRKHQLYPMIWALILQNFFNPNRFPPDYFPQIIPRTPGFLWVRLGSRRLQIYPF